jgi:hypothetical protein
MSWAYGTNGARAINVSGTVSSLAYPNNDTVGSLLIASVCYYCGTGAGSGDVTLSDNAPSGGNAWTKVCSYWDNSLGVWLYISIFYAINTKGTGAEKLTVTIGNYNANCSSSALVIEEVTGNASSSPGDGTAYGYVFTPYTNSSGQTLNGPALSTGTDGDLIFAALFDLQDNISALTHGSGFTSMHMVTTTEVTGTEYEVQGTHGAITPSFASITADASGDAQIIACAFKVSTGGGSNMVQREVWWKQTAYNQ